MIPRIPADPALRGQRKANLLLASELLRGQAQTAVDDIGQRADGLVHRVLVVREGRITGEVEGDDMTEEKIMQLASINIVHSPERA